MSYSETIDAAATDPTLPAQSTRKSHRPTEEQVKTAAEKEILHLPAEAPTTQNNITTTATSRTEANNSYEGSHEAENYDHGPSAKVTGTKRAEVLCVVWHQLPRDRLEGEVVCGGGRLNGM